MAELTTDIRKQYTQRVVELWLECLDFAQESQKYLLKGNAQSTISDENEIILEYIARLIQLWRELGPKVKSRVELKELENEFISFEQYSQQPRMLLDEPDKIIALEAIIRNVLDKLGITAIENMK